MTTVFRSPTTCLQFFNNAGQPNVGGTLLTQVGGVNTATFQDAAGTIPLPNPIPLNSRGEVSNASGASCELFLIEGTTYTFTLFDANGNQIGVYPNINGINDPSLYTVNATSIPYTPPGASSVTTTVADELGYIQPRNVFDAYSLAQIENVQSNTGTLDVYAALGAANAWGVALYIPSGLHYVSTGITFTVPVEFENGATFNVAAGQTITFNQKLTGPVNQIFSLGSGAAVVINPQYTNTGYPEWWGAQSGNSAVDCSTGINACIAACPVTVLQQAQYWIANTINMQTGGRSLIGVNPNISTSGGDNATILTESATINMMLIGPTFTGPYPYTGTIQDLNAVRNVAFVRNVAPNLPSVCRGIIAQYTSWLQFDNVFVQDSCVCFHLMGTSATRFSNCNTWKHYAGASGVGSADQFYGWLIDGGTNYINLYSDTQNASVELWRCSCTATDLTALAINSAWDFQGMSITGTYGWSDIFVDTFETNGLAQGIQMVGNGNTSSTFDYKNRDCRFINLVLDANYIAGITFNALSLFGNIQVTHSYMNFHPLGVAAKGFDYGNSNASVQVSQCVVDCYGNSSGTPPIAVYAAGSRGIDHRNNVYYESAATPLQLIGTVLSRFEDRIRNYSVTCAGAAVTVGSSSTRNVFDMHVEGKSGAFTQGYFITDGTTSYSEYRCSGLEQSCITNWKLDNNGTQITSAGAFSTTNLASGIMN